MHQALADQILFHPAAGCDDGNFAELEGLISWNFIGIVIAGRMVQLHNIYYTAILAYIAIVSCIILSIPFLWVPGVSTYTTVQFL